MRLIIVRHAESEANVKHHLQGQSPGALTERGHQQANQLALALTRQSIDVIITSDLTRAADTARPIAEATGVPLQLSAELREWHVGELDGQPASRLDQLLSDPTLSKVDFRPAGGESLRELRQRAATFLHKLIDTYPDQTVLLCSHGDFIRMLLGVMLDQPIEAAADRHLDNTSISILNLVGQQWQIECLNNTDHLL